MRKKILIIATSFVISTLCYSTGQAQGASPRKLLNRIVAKVNEDTITLSEFNRRKALYTSMQPSNSPKISDEQMIQQIALMDIAYQTEVKKGLNRTVIDNFVKSYYEKNKALYTKAGFTKKQADKEITQKILLSVVSQQSGLTPNELAKKLFQSAYIKTCLVTTPSYQLLVYQSDSLEKANAIFNKAKSGEKVNQPPKEINSTLDDLPLFRKAVQDHHSNEVIQPFFDEGLGMYNVVKIVKVTQPSSC